MLFIYISLFFSYWHAPDTYDIMSASEKSVLARSASDEITEWVHSRSDERKQWAVPSNKNVADLCLHKVGYIFVGW